LKKAIPGPIDHDREDGDGALLQFGNGVNQSEREEFNLWLKIMNMIGHHKVF
jgi:hypothetical protein